MEKDRKEVEEHTLEIMKIMNKFRQLNNKKSGCKTSEKLLSHAEFFTLMTLRGFFKKKQREGMEYDGVTVTKLMELMEMSLPATSKMIKQLEEKGCIERTNRKNDKRVVVLNLTEKGKLMLEEEFGKMKETMYRVFSKLSEEELTRFTDTLKKIYSYVKEEMEE